MSLFDQLSGVLRGAAGGDAARATTGILETIQGQGGLGNLVQSFEGAGLGHLVQSWIGTGQNLPVSAQQIEAALGSGWLAQLAQRTGLAQPELLQHLSTVLPQLIDHLTPNGQVPQPAQLNGLLGSLMQQFTHR